MPEKNKYHTLSLILGDQLDIQHSWFLKPGPDVLFVIAELKSEATYVKHHIQKLCAFFLSMQKFAEELQAQNHHVLYLTLDDVAEHHTFSDLLAHLCNQFKIQQFNYQRPDEYRLHQVLCNLELPTGVTVREYESEHFFLPQGELAKYIKKGKHNRMESFYRKMRKRFEILMEGEKPRGEKWNYDSDNRQKFKSADLEVIPEPLEFANKIDKILRRIDKHDIPYIGQMNDHLLWPASRSQAVRLLEHFCVNCLPNFGRFQDAMTGQHPHKWSLYHSRLSFALNSKLLRPGEVIRKAIDTFEHSEGQISLPQIEGFVRQILGWREYIRAVYWVNMPEYAERNEFGAMRSLPEYFWNGETRMECVAQAIRQSLEYAYAHHIQRLMVTGNFCMLAGVAPDQVDAWYLGIYIDAIEWVELPNTRGMSQFADGGLVATKPYSAGGNYINKMSDYCNDCHYDVKEKTSDLACPFNSLYWDFMVRHRNRLEKNPRTGMVYKNWDRQAKESRVATLAKAKWCIEHLEEL